MARFPRLRRLERKSQTSDSRVDDGCLSEYEFTISLRLRHPGVDPASITHTLAIEPQHSWKAGDPRRDPAGAALQGVHRESFWVAQLMEQPQLATAGVSVESVLLQTLAHLRRSQSFLAQLDAEGGVAELHVSVFARTDFRLELSAQSLALLGHLGLAVALDVHPQPAHAASEPEAL